jgi:hypothetical protein
MSGDWPRDETLATVTGQIEDVREALRAQNRALAIMVRNQQLHGEMLAKTFEAVARAPDGDALAELLAALVDADRRHAAALAALLDEARRGRC